jgi:quercetin dioxygenase-like cupin family protein
MNRFTAAGLVALGIGLGAGGLALAQASLPQPTAAVQTQALGSIDLGKAFPNMQGYSLNMRLTTIPTGGGRAMHSHREAPEIVHIVSGVLSDQHQGGAPLVHGPGSTVINDESVDHMILNQGAEPVVMYAVSVSKTPAKP